MEDAKLGELLARLHSIADFTTFYMVQCVRIPAPLPTTAFAIVEICVIMELTAQIADLWVSCACNAPIPEPVSILPLLLSVHVSGTCVGLDLHRLPRPKNLPIFPQCKTEELLPSHKNIPG